MKKKAIIKKRFKNVQEMDDHLENMDWSGLIKKHGVLKSGKHKKINLDLPPHMVDQIDLLTAKIGVSRQPLLKIWIHERLQQEFVEKNEISKVSS